jgi:GGDEF domain-containing protein
LSAPHQSYDLEVGLLDADGLAGTLEAELARAARHELPLTLVLLEVSGTGLHEGGDLRERVVHAVAEVLRERTRAEDWAARLGPLRFAVVAVETAESEAVAENLTDHVRKTLARLGPEGHGLFVAAGAVDCQYDELSGEELLREASRALSAAANTDVLRKSA